MTATDPLLSVTGLRKWFGGGGFGRRKPPVQAVTGVSFEVGRGEVVGLVGESGSGKTTVAQCILRLYEPDAGEIRFDGVDISHLGPKALQPHRRRLQMIFQDPYSSLNPKLTAGASIAEPMEVHGIGDNAAGRRALVAELLGQVGLRPEHAERYPHEFSGGQRQRIGIARALAVRPDLVVADEPVSALDVSVQAQIIELLERLRREFSLSMLMVAHDLAVVRYISDRVIVMYLGTVVEIGPADELYARPLHPYTRALLSAAPRLQGDKRVAREVLHGELPSPINPPSGCVFRTRCPIAEKRCAETVPPLRDMGGGRKLACLVVDGSNTGAMP
jgi:oligopeptide/dipeptide ABC transporter ATP-binding protein